MNGKQLKNSILQLAIEGRLVPQEPNDESAIELLHRINPKIKPITEDTPFDIPESWEWCRVGDIFDHNTGKALNKSVNTEGQLLPYLTTSNVYWDKFDLTEVRKMYFKESEIDKCTIKKGDLLVCEGGDIGRSAIWNSDENICIQNHLHRLRAKGAAAIHRFYLYVLMLFKEKQLIMGKGIGLMGLSSRTLDNLTIPLPPLAEQRRIVERIEELMPLVERYAQAQEGLDKLNGDIRGKLRRSILQEAIEGRLVPQEPNDEPAIELLHRINPKFSPPQYDDTLPQGWSACRLGEVANYINGRAFKPEEWKTEGLPIIRIQNLTDHSTPFNYSPCTYEDKYLIKDGDLLFAWSATLDSFIWNRGDAWLNQHIFKVEPFAIMDKYYLYYLLKAMILNIYAKTHGSGMVHITRKIFEDLPILVPPLAEQRRIVERIEELFAVLERIG